MADFPVNLYLTPAEVNAVLGDIEAAIKESNSITEELGEVMATLAAYWEGVALNSYFAVYNRYKETTIVQLNLLMRAYLTAYNEAVQAMLIAPMPPVHFDF